ncbi:MAG: acetamidase/formamidase family protein [Gammaproteobacteria bacterium]|nr:acetamidase/formamidase family protein [Gammaproteobacteria bacterium]
MKCQHTLHHAQGHRGWDNTNAPRLSIAPGESIEFQALDASDGQLNPQSVADDLSRLDFARVNPVVGPVYIDGAAPGDVIKVTLLDFTPSGWGWTGNIPGFGLLAEEFPAPHLHHWHYDVTSRTPALYGPGGRVPLKPMCGTIGLAPAEAGHHSIVPPRRVGGNMDIRDLAAGTELYLPVEVAGGLFSLGDAHAAQGDGEICGTAIETACSIAAKFELIKNTPLATPRFTTPGPVSRHLDGAGYEVTTGIGPDLMVAARDALRNMIDVLSAQHGMAAIDAYMLCSVCGDLRISEIVDMPNWVVSFYFPRVVFG